MTLGLPSQVQSASSRPPQSQKPTSKNRLSVFLGAAPAIYLFLLHGNNPTNGLTIQDSLG